MQSPKSHDGHDANQADEEIDDDEVAINTHSFEELQMDSEEARAAHQAWTAFLAIAGSQEAAGDAIFIAIFEAAPQLQALFTSARAMHINRFITSLNSCFTSLEDPPGLKTLIETIGFSHMQFDIKVPHIVIFRTAILDVFSMELGEVFTSSASNGVMKLINYIGGAMIYVKSNYAERFRVLTESWQQANAKKDEEEEELLDQGGEEDMMHKDSSLKPDPAETKKTRMGRLKGAFKRSGKNADKGATEAGKFGQDSENGSSTTVAGSVQQIPTVFPEMFRFNAAVMGFGSSIWMNEVLAAFDNIVPAMSNSSWLQEECDVLALRISNVTKAEVNLAEYKACMLASLRSLLPKDWSPKHEVAWTWLWDNVQRLVSKNLKTPVVYEKAIHRFLDALDEDKAYSLRKDVYAMFFEQCPRAESHFKQSNTRLHFIVESVMKMTLEIFHDPIKMVDDISALGLRHVAYGIPTELFPPFVTALMEVLLTYNSDAVTLEAFGWSLNLIQKMLVRTIIAGSTIVMKAINANSTKMLKKAISCAPRGKRASWMLTVQVGSQSISPLEWAIESGNLDAAKAIMIDLLTFRADRERYYYGMEHLFTRHPDIINMLCTSGPSLLPTLLDGLIWRSRATKNGIRRVNFYCKYLLVNREGGHSQALEWFAKSGDSKIISHPVNVLTSDTLWKGIVRKQFMGLRIWFLLSLVIFMLSQAILPKLTTNDADMQYLRIIVFSCRAINYLTTMLRLSLKHAKRIIFAYCRKDLVWHRCLPLPRYLEDPYELGNFILAGLMISMCAHEPMLHCYKSDKFPTEYCPESDDVLNWWYSVLSMVAMAMHWLLIIDMAVFSTKLAAFLLVCRQILSEFSRFLIALGFLLLAFGSAIACLRRDHDDFKDVPNCVQSLFAITLLLMPRDYRELQYDPALLIIVFIFVTASVILLLNLLIAQLNCAYEYICADMIGFARLNRASVIVESLPTVTKAKWEKFMAGLKLDQRVEFNEGDIGLAGAIQLIEPASLNPITEETIHRYGGTCSPEMRWPQEQDAASRDRVERMEEMVKKALKKVGRGDPSGSVGGVSGGVSGGGASAGIGGATGDESFSGSDISL